jgi:hypothetical protein
VYLKVSPMKGVKRFRVKGKLSPRFIVSFLILLELWKCGIQAGITTVVGRSSRHLLCILAKEVLEGTHGCYIAGSGTTRNRLDISRIFDQDLGSKESCHKAQDDQVL